MKIETVYLLNPPCYNEKDRLVREGRCMQRESSWSNLWMPLTLCIIKAHLQKELGLNCKVRDAVADRFSMDKVLDEIKKLQPEMVVINTAVPSIMVEDLDAAKKIKELNNEIFVAMIGVPATTMTKWIYNDPRGKHVDACVHHESELPLVELIRVLQRNENWKNNKGVAYGKEGQIVYNGAMPLPSLDVLPPADFSDLSLKEYTLPFTKNKVVMIETSRGCPSMCNFCVGKEYYTRNFRFKDPEAIVDEMEACISRYKVKSFLFWADTWMMGGQKAEQVCDSIIKRGLDVEFLCNGRVNNSYLTLLEKMKKAGCLVVAYGVESAVQEILDRNRKGIMVGQIEQAIKNANKAGVPNTAHVIVGLPGETWDTVKLTTQRLIKFNPTYVNAYCPVPYPGTEMYEEAIRKGWIKTNQFGMFEELHAVMRNDDMSAEEIIKAKQSLIKKFYFRPRIFAREIKRVIDERSPKRAFYLGVDGFRFMQGWVFGGKSI